MVGEGICLVKSDRLAIQYASLVPAHTHNLWFPKHRYHNKCRLKHNVVKMKRITNLHLCECSAIDISVYELCTCVQVITAYSTHEPCSNCGVWWTVINVGARADFLLKCKFQWIGIPKSVINLSIAIMVYKRTSALSLTTQRPLLIILYRRYCTNMRLSWYYHRDVKTFTCNYFHISSCKN